MYPTFHFRFGLALARLRAFTHRLRASCRPPSPCFASLALRLQPPLALRLHAFASLSMLRSALRRSRSRLASGGSSPLRASCRPPRIVSVLSLRSALPLSAPTSTRTPNTYRTRIAAPAYLRYPSHLPQPNRRLSQPRLYLAVLHHTSLNPGMIGALHGMVFQNKIV